LPSRDTYTEDEVISMADSLFSHPNIHVLAYLLRQMKDEIVSKIEDSGSSDPSNTQSLKTLADVRVMLNSTAAACGRTDIV